MKCFFKRSLKLIWQSVTEVDRTYWIMIERDEGYGMWPNSVSENDREWQRMTEDDRGWQMMTEDDIGCQRMSENDRVWEKMTECDRLWRKMMDHKRGLHSLKESDGLLLKNSLTECDEVWLYVTEGDCTWQSVIKCAKNVCPSMTVC